MMGEGDMEEKELIACSECVDFTKCHHQGCAKKESATPTPNRYRWSWRGVSFDFYRLCEILGLKSEPQKHAIKKFIRAGQSVKTTAQDIDEGIAAAERWKEMLREDEESKPAP